MGHLSLPFLINGIHLSFLNLLHFYSRIYFGFHYFSMSCVDLSYSCTLYSQCLETQGLILAFLQIDSLGCWISQFLEEWSIWPRGLGQFIEVSYSFLFQIVRLGFPRFSYSHMAEVLFQYYFNFLVAVIQSNW